RNVRTAGTPEAAGDVSGGSARGVGAGCPGQHASCGKAVDRARVSFCRGPLPTKRESGVERACDVPLHADVLALFRGGGEAIRDTEGIDADWGAIVAVPGWSEAGDAGSGADKRKRTEIREPRLKVDKTQGATTSFS